MQREPAWRTNRVGSLHARAVVVGLLLATTLVSPGCTADAASQQPAPTQALCERKVPTFPVRPRRTEGPDGVQIYAQSVSPIIAAVPASGHLCRYRDSDLSMFATFTPPQLQALPGMLNELPAATPVTCADGDTGLAVDLVRVVDRAGALRRIVVGHDGCTGVITDGQVRTASAELLKWLDRVLSDEGRLRVPPTPSP